MDVDLQLDEQPPSQRPAAAALAALANHTLLAQITQFQLGIPMRIHELVATFCQRYPNESSVSNTRLFWESALRCGDLADLQLLCRMRITRDADDDALEWLHTSDLMPAQWSTSMLHEAVCARQYDAARWLMAHRPTACTNSLSFCMATVAYRGDCGMLKELVAFGPDALTPHVMDAAMMQNQWPVIMYLHTYMGLGCSLQTMDNAAAHGLAGVVFFLHDHHFGGCSVNTMDVAAANGHLDIVEFLHERRTEGCTTNAVDIAAANGHLDGFTDTAITRALEAGHVRVASYLEQQRERQALLHHVVA